jgi:hypothetical protein
MNGLEFYYRGNFVVVEVVVVIEPQTLPTTMSLKVLLNIAAFIGEAIRCNHRIAHELHSYRAHKGFVLSFYKLSRFHVEQQWQVEAREERLAILLDPDHIIIAPREERSF